MSAYIEPGIVVLVALLVCAGLELVRQWRADSFSAARVWRSRRDARIRDRFRRYTGGE